MPNPVQAAAEGLPSINRRRALALTGTGLITALAGACATVAHGKADPVALAADDGDAELHALVRALNVARAKEDSLWKAMSELEVAVWPSRPARPGVEYGFRVNIDGKRVPLYALTEERINEVADQLDRGIPLMRSDARERNKGLRQQWIDELRRQDAAVDAWEVSVGLEAAEIAAVEAGRITHDLADRVISYPCASFRDVQDIAILMLEAKDQGDTLFGTDEMAEFLTSIARKAVLA